MAEFSVSSLELRNKATTLNEYNQKFMQEKNNLVDAKVALMKGFEGDAAAAFESTFNTFVAQMDNFKAVVDEYVNKLNEEADSYDKADSTSTMTAERK